MRKILDSLKEFIKRECVLIGVDFRYVINPKFNYFEYLTSGEKVLVIEKIQYEYRISPLIQYSVSEHYYRYYMYMSYSRNRMRQNNICCFMVPLTADFKAKAFLNQKSVYEMAMEQFLRLDDIKDMGAYTRESIINDLACYLEVCSYTGHSNSFEYIAADLATYYDKGLGSLTNQRLMDIERINYIKSGFRFPEKTTQVINEPAL